MPARRKDAKGEPILTPRELLFVAGLAQGKSYTQAALDAGYAPDYAAQIGAENYRKPEIAAAVAKRLGPISVNTELEQNLAFAKKVREACDVWLSDPDEPEKYCLEPRASEIQVVYLDSADLDDKGKPTKKKALLSELINRLERQLDLRVTSRRLTGADPRKLILDALDKANDTIDKYAKVTGAYKNPDDNPDKVARDKENLEKVRELFIAARAEHLKGTGDEGTAQQLALGELGTWGFAHLAEEITKSEAVQ
jgi:hypothetical protein